MYLNDFDILERVKNYDMITDYRPTRLQAGSYDCRINNGLVDPHTGERWLLQDNPFIEPGQFLLATTVEEVNIPDNLICQVWGKSSNGRMGLFIQNAGWVDPGFRGELTLELFNCSKDRIDLSKLKGICQLSFAQMTDRAVFPYCGHYQDQKGATESYLKEDQ